MIAFDQLAFSDDPTQARERRLTLDGRALDLAVPVLVQLKVQVSRGKLAQPQHVTWLDGPGQNYVGGRADATQREKGDRAVRRRNQTQAIDNTDGADSVPKLKFEVFADREERVALVGVEHDPAFDQPEDRIPRGAVIHAGCLRELA